MRIEPLDLRRAINMRCLNMITLSDIGNRAVAILILQNNQIGSTRSFEIRLRGTGSDNIEVIESDSLYCFYQSGPEAPGQRGGTLAPRRYRYTLLGTNITKIRCGALQEPTRQPYRCYDLRPNALVRE